MDKKLSASIFIEGPDADKINPVDLFTEVAEKNGLDYKVTSASVSCHYNPAKKEEKK